MKEEAKFGGNRRSIALHVSLSPYKLGPGDLDKLAEAVRGITPLRPAVLAELKKMYPNVELLDGPLKFPDEEDQDKWLSSVIERIWSGEDDDTKPI